MADEPNKDIPIDPHAVPDADPAGTEAASTPAAAETGTRAAGATRAATGGQDADVPAPPAQEAPVPEAPAHKASAPDVSQHTAPADAAPQHVAPQLETSPPSASALGAPQYAATHAVEGQQASWSNSASVDGEHKRKPRIPLWYALKRTIRGFSNNQVTNLAAALTYYAVLAVAPTLVALVSILGVVNKDQGPKIVKGVLDIVKDIGSEDAVKGIEPILDQVLESPGAGIALIVGVLIAMWSASSYVTAFSRASNRIYDVAEGRPIWKLRPAMYLVTFVLIVIVAVAGAMLITSGPIAKSIGELIGLSDAAVFVWSIAKWPVVLLLALIAIALLYRRTPNVRPRKFQLISWGAAVAIVVWVIASVGLGIYVANFSNYGATYGTLAGVIIFLLWVWISNLALLFGAQLDAELERGRQLCSGIMAEEDIQLRRRDTKASDKQASKERKVVAEGREIRMHLTGEHNES